MKAGSDFYRVVTQPDGFVDGEVTSGSFMPNLEMKDPEVLALESRNQENVNINHVTEAVGGIAVVAQTTRS